MAKNRKDSAKEALAVKCGICEKSVGERDSGVQCEMCEAWFHASCSGVDEIYSMLGKNENLHWFCNQCSKNVKKTLLNLARMDDRVNKVELDITTMRSEFDTKIGGVNKEIEVLRNEKSKVGHDLNKLKEVDDKELSRVSDEIMSVRKQMEECVNATNVEEQEATWASVASQQVDVKLGIVDSEVQMINKSLEEAKKATVELQDKETRRNDIVMYRVPESTEVTAEARNVQDKRFCEQLLFGLQVGIAEEDIRKVMRLGRRVEPESARSAESADNARPILIQLGSRTAKNLIMESLYKLKSMEAKFRKVVVAHDMTKLERDDCKALVNEAKVKTENDSGDWVYRIRGPPGQMRIVKMRRH